MTKNKHFHYKQKINEHCPCIACMIDRGEYHNNIVFEDPILECDEQKNKIDKFIEDNKPIPWYNRLLSSVLYFFYSEKSNRSKSSGKSSDINIIDNS